MARTQTVYKVVRKSGDRLYSFGYDFTEAPEEIHIQYKPGKFVRSNGLMPYLFAFKSYSEALDFKLKYGDSCHEIWKCEAVVSKATPKIYNAYQLIYHLRHNVKLSYRFDPPNGTICCQMIKLIEKVL